MKFHHWINKFIFISCFAISSAQAAMTSTDPHSAYRVPDEDWKVAASRHLKKMMTGADDTIYGTALKWNKINLEQQQTLLNEIPFWPNYDAIQEQFIHLRDYSHLTDPMSEQMKRSIPWRYPVDYCFKRAAAAAQLFNNHTLPRPAKVFAFGQISLLSPYAPYDGVLNFWYHVAPVIRDRETNKVYVLDPSLNFDGPLPLTAWLEQLVERSPKKDLLVNICNGYAFSPSQNCQRASEALEKDTANNLVRQLPAEWDLLQIKGINSQKILNTEPINKAAKIIYGSIDFKMAAEITKFADNVVVEYKSPNETDWNVLLDISKVNEQKERHDYFAYNNIVTIGSVFGKPSRSKNCECTYLSCRCTLAGNKDDIELRIRLNDQIIKQCTYNYPQNKNLINYSSIGPDIHYQFDVDKKGKISTYYGAIEGCVEKA